MPWLRPAKVVAGTVPLTVTVGLVKPPLRAKPLPLGPTVSMKYSAAMMLLAPWPASLTVAEMLGAVRVRLGVTLRLELAGGAVSMVKVVVPLVPALPAASLWLAWAVYVPSGRVEAACTE